MFADEHLGKDFSAEATWIAALFRLQRWMFSAIDSGADFARRAQPLGVDVDDERDQQDDPSNQNLEETVDLHVVQTVVEHAEDEQSDDGVADAAAPAEQAGAPRATRPARLHQKSADLPPLPPPPIPHHPHPP